MRTVAIPKNSYDTKKDTAKAKSAPAIERIPGVPHTADQLRKAVRRSEKQYAKGRTVTLEQVREKHPRI